MPDYPELKMKTIIIALSLSSMCVISLAFAEPYANKVEITSATSPLGQMVINAAIVPDQSAVDIPAYPGAVIFQTYGAGAMDANGTASLPYIKMLTPDQIDKVVAWYESQLPTYYHQKEEFFGTVINVFWKEKGNYNALDMEARMSHQNIGISDGSMHKDDYPQSTTMIEISYTGK